MDPYGDSRSGHLGELVLAANAGQTRKALQRSLATRMWGDVLALQYAESVDEVPAVVLGLSADGATYDAVIDDDLRLSLRVYSTSSYGGVITIPDSIRESRRIGDWLYRCSDWGITPLTLFCHVSPDTDVIFDGSRLTFDRPTVFVVRGMRGHDWHEFLREGRQTDAKGEVSSKADVGKEGTRTASASGRGPLPRARFPVTLGGDVAELFLSVEGKS